MITDELSLLVSQQLGFPPTAEQQNAMQVFARFMTSREPTPAMILRGSAGTGKTTLAGAIVRAMSQLRQKLVLLAPTGRAAKVFTLHAGRAAYTIHRRIYRQRTAGDLSAFSLNTNMQADTLFIVDEASMIMQRDSAAPSSGASASFGSGSLLDDLVQFVYSGASNCRLLLIGDRAQLPPVGEQESPALMADVLRRYGLNVYEADLRQVLRQAEGSGILYNATRIRGKIEGLNSLALPTVRFHGFPDIRCVPGDELIEQLATSYSHAGLDETIVITRSNKRANIYNQGIRRTVLDRDDLLCRGDQLMVVRNNYYWKPQPPPNSGEAPSAGSTPFLANGDRCVVQRVRHVHELYGFHFADADLCFPDYDDLELTATLLLDTLTAEAPALTHEQQEQLYAEVMADLAENGVTTKPERLRQLKQDAHYNALQVKYAYAVTCHKAQGGQWAHVYVDQGYMTDDMLTPDYIRWLYTAFTRATESLFLVNWPASQTEQPIT